MDGVVVIDKPKSRTSFWVVDKIRDLTGVKKVGHTGTLDPLATGVLPICIGEATKAADLFMSGDKIYEVTAKLGERTDTLDAEGKVVDQREVSSANVSRDALIKVINKFVGEIEQTPPMYSALKKDGVPLYKLARKGIDVDRQKRKVNINHIELLEMNTPFFSLRVDCSKGTYIRSLVDDIGVELGTFAHVTELRRTRSGVFDIKDSCQLDSELNILSLEKALSMLLPVVDVDKDVAVKIAKGYQIDLWGAGIENVPDNFVARSIGKDGAKKIVAIIKDKKISRVFNYSDWGV